jgi:hypothetical protein
MGTTGTVIPPGGLVPLVRGDARSFVITAATTPTAANHEFLDSVAELGVPTQHRLMIAESARFPELALMLHSSGDARRIARLPEHIWAEHGPASDPTR